MNDSELNFLPPSDLLAERMILASVLTGVFRFDLISDSLSAEDFSLESHRRIWRRAEEVAQTGAAVDRITVAHALVQAGQIESVGGFSYLSEIDAGMPIQTNLDAYVSIVRDKSILRRAIQYHQRAIEECCIGAESTMDLMLRAERSLSDLSTRAKQKTDLASALESVMQAGGPRMFTHPEQFSVGLKTPWPRLDQQLEGGGMLPGQMITIGARPSLGKTSLACQIALKTAAEGGGTALFSLEMSSRAILMRLACTLAQVDSLAHSQGRSNEYQRKQLTQALIDLTESYRLWIAARCYTLPAIRSELIRLAAREKIGLIVVDYLQLMEPTGSAGRNRTEQISELSRGLKRLAEEFSCTIVVLSQLNRDMERESRAPRLSDLRDGGSVEQDSDVVLLPHRLPEQPEHADEVNVDLIIAKQRNGALGRIPLTFYRRFTKFQER